MMLLFLIRFDERVTCLVRLFDARGRVGLGAEVFAQRLALRLQINKFQRWREPHIGPDIQAVVVATGS